MIRNDLFSLADENYKNFHKKLIPTIDENCLIGVRTPALRKYAKKIFRTTEADEFLKILPHKYYEENNLHAFLIEQVKDFEECIKLTEQFLPFIDNWATCDGFKPKVFKSNHQKLYPFILKWIKSNEVYTIRYGIVTLMTHFLDDDFNKADLSLIVSINSDEYYVNMALAWYLSFALIKQYDSTIELFEQGKIKNKWVHNKALQKARESYRIDGQTKKYLNSLKIK